MLESFFGKRAPERLPAAENPAEAVPAEAVPAEAVPAPDFDIPPLDPHEKVLNGKHAQVLLADPLLNAVFESVATKYRQAWENASRGDLETQQTAHLSLAALKDVIGAIRVHLGNAKLYEADLAARKKSERGIYG